MDLRTRSNAIEGDNYEVVLTVTITAKLDDETAFLVEVQQAGIFFVRGIVTKGTFPALMLAQINFDALYAQAVQQSQQQAAAGEAGAEGGESAGEAES